ncbi:hypothetical protein [Niallia endozanthoxylica]|uniref:hypothetical protein n=1 Tax=Niallia endozanthoxylica TaxID=2036016 RepID=UPI00168B2D56|nr:hypothetical protein [Niallia endozanthoxylica]
MPLKHTTPTKKTTRNQQEKTISNVEFGMEFGDMNASKQYEFPFITNKDQVKERK